MAEVASFTDTAQAEAAARFAIDKGWTTAVTFSVPGPYFGYVVEVFTEEYESLGGQVLGDYPLVPGQTTDFSAQVNEIAGLDLAFITNLCDRVYCLDQGSVIAVGSPAEIRTHPAVRAAYLGG
ncbi:MAG: hypothetical protein OXC00_07320 [Acidimicrobiaceae bacterium]|nr:hypothetical protein [Acidimicrobiaceae bacterium]